MSDPFFLPAKGAPAATKRKERETPTPDAPGKRPRHSSSRKQHTDDSETPRLPAAAAAASASAAENADERRVRMAREYLDRVRDEAGGDDAAVDARLRADATEASGRGFRAIARSLQQCEATGEDSRVARFVRGHRESVTAVALSGDGRRAYSASKDGTVLCWDAETGARVCAFPGFVRRSGKGRQHTAKALALALSSDGRLLASGGEDKKVHLWDVGAGKEAGTLAGHKEAVTALAFRHGARQLFSGGADRCVKVWNAESLAYVETLFGHQAPVLGIDCLDRERALSAGADGTVRLWKVSEESQLVYHGGHTSSIDAVALISENSFVAGGQDGAVSLWMASKKAPVDVRRAAHGQGSWISAVAACKRTDLVASSSSNGVVQLWRVARGKDRDEDEDEAAAAAPRLPRLVPLHGIGSAVGFANSLAFSQSGELLVVGLGQEPRMGRWARNGDARNGLLFARLSYNDD